MTVGPEKLRSVLRRWASGVTVVTAGYEGTLHGMTVSSFSSVSLDPQLISVNIERRTRTHELMDKAGAFAVCILANDQQELAQRFGGAIPDIRDRFTGLEARLGQVGAPILQGCLAVLECRIHATLPAGTHTIFVGEVVAVSDTNQATPLIYFNRKYRGLMDTP